MTGEEIFGGTSEGSKIENEARKRIDLSADSPFHSLGKGPAQAAPGNHDHPEHLTADEIIAGNNITINDNSDGTITIHGASPGAPISDHGALTGRDVVDQHPIKAITGLQQALDGKSGTSHTHNYSPTGHNHSGTYSEVNHVHTAVGVGVVARRRGPYSIPANSDIEVTGLTKKANDIVTLTPVHSSSRATVSISQWGATTYSYKIRNTSTSTDISGVYVHAMQVET